MHENFAFKIRRFAAPGPVTRLRDISIRALTILSATKVMALTPVSGVVDGEEWTAAGSPYSVIGDVVVVDLAIHPGVTVSFAGPYEFKVQGRLRASGSQESPIVFTSSNSNTNGWGGILIQNASPTPRLDFCVIEKARRGGVRIVDASSIFNDCTIARNRTPENGGGISATGPTSSLFLTNCTITDNFAAGNGGGISAVLTSNLLSLQRCRIDSNRVQQEGGLNSYSGGGLYISARAVLNNCLVVNNSCSNAYGGNVGGGGILIAGGSVSLKNSTVSSNIATGFSAFGGGVHLLTGAASLQAQNSIISYNSTVMNAAGGNDGRKRAEGAGIFLGPNPDTANTARIEMANCTVTHNSSQAMALRGPVNASAKNSIFYFNNGGGAPFLGDPRQPDVSYSCVQGGYPGEGNISVDPLLRPDAKLFPESECIDAGDPDPQFDDLCLDSVSAGLTRNDLGAFGGAGACEWLSSEKFELVGATRNQSTFLGRTVYLRVSATGVAPFLYRWYHDGNLLENEIGDQLIIPDVRPDHAGVYTAKVKDSSGGGVLSMDANVHVDSARVSLDRGLKLVIEGAAGYLYGVEYNDGSDYGDGRGGWMTAGQLRLTNISGTWEPTDRTSPHRFYRVQVIGRQ